MKNLNCRGISIAPNERIYITIPYGSLKNSGLTKVYKVPHKLNLNRIIKFWFDNVDKNKTYTY